MAKKKQEEPTEGVQVESEKKTGTVAPKAEQAAAVAPHPKKLKIPKLAKKNKSRLPRRQKKALRKAAQL